MCTYILASEPPADCLSRTIGLTPSASSDLVLIERVCLEYPLRSVHNMTKARQGQPFRFVYVSGRLAQRDQSKRPFYKPDWALIRVCMFFFADFE
jgi:hypothetical protein